MAGLGLGVSFRPSVRFDVNNSQAHGTRIDVLEHRSVR
jgi:hypothetical protein